MVGKIHIGIFRVLTLIGCYQGFKWTYCLHFQGRNESSRFFQNSDICLPVYTVSYLRTPWYESPMLWKPQILYVCLLIYSTIFIRITTWQCHVCVFLCIGACTQTFTHVCAHSSFPLWCLTYSSVDIVSLASNQCSLFRGERKVKLCNQV